MYNSTLEHVPARACLSLLQQSIPVASTLCPASRPHNQASRVVHKKQVTESCITSTYSITSTLTSSSYVSPVPINGSVMASTNFSASDSKKSTRDCSKQQLLSFRNRNAIIVSRINTSTSRQSHCLHGNTLQKKMTQQQTAGCLSFHPLIQCVVHALKGLACRASPIRAR